MNVAFALTNDALFEHKAASRTPNDAFHEHKAALLDPNAALLSRTASELWRLREELHQAVEAAFPAFFVRVAGGHGWHLLVNDDHIRCFTMFFEPHRDQ